MKKMTAWTLIACMLLSLLTCIPALLPVSAAETRLTTDKTTYAQGEPILVTATGTGTDWVGLYCADDTYDPDAGGQVSIYWYYVASEGNTSGQTKDIYASEYNNFATRPEFESGLPVGNYKVALMANNGYSVIEEVTITIVESTDDPGTDTPTTPDFSDMPTEQNPLITDKTVYTEGDPIYVKALGSGKDWVGIYVAGDTPGPIPSIYWFYVEEEGYKAGDKRHLQSENFSADRGAYADLPAGEYTLLLALNDGYEARATLNLTIIADGTKPPTTPAEPAEATYRSADAGRGRADGTVTIRHGGTAPEAYVLRWADANGAIKGYTDIARVPCKGAETVYTLTPNTLVPEGADRILVYAANGTLLSQSAVVANLPADADSVNLGELKYEMQVMSDIHINASDSHIHNRHFAAALAEIQEISPNSIGIFINGDIADHGQQAEYDAFNRLVKAAGQLPPIHCAIGNHDLGAAGADAQKIATFLAGTGNDSETVYFEREINGIRFIFLGSESTSTEANLSGAQLKWLKQTLDKKSEGPVYLFLHQGIMDTVAGTFEYQGWHGVIQETQLKAILADHPEVILFSGHSHWMLESTQSFKPADEKLPAILNTSSVGYLWDDSCPPSHPGIVGSQGYYIYVYENGIVFRGRDFANEAWVSSAQFILPLNEDELNRTEEESTSESTSESTAEPVESESGSVADTASASSDTNGTVVDSGANRTAAPVEEEGCKSAIPGMALALILSAAAVCLHRRKPLL